MPSVSLIVPHFKQELPYSCVAACVRMVLAKFGHNRSEDELRQHLGTGTRGTPARSLLLLDSLGFDVRLELANLAQLHKTLAAGIPPLVFLDTTFLDYWKLQCDHVAVLVGIDLATVALNDPYFDTAPQQSTLAGFQAAWACNKYFAAFISPKP